MFQLDLLAQPHFRYLFFQKRTNGLKKAQFDQILFQKIDTPWNSKLLRWKSNFEILGTLPCDFNKFPIHLGTCMHPLSFTPYLNVQIFQFPFILGRTLYCHFVSWSHTQVRVPTSFFKCWFELHVPCDHPKNISTFSMTFTLLLHTQWPVMWKCRA